MSNMPILLADRISKKFGSTQALNHLSLSLSSGQCLALLGPNGAGKTTACEILEGLVTPDSGSVKIDGMAYKKNRREIQQLIGVQLQETNLYKRFTVKETLELFASFYPNALPVPQLIKQLGLSEKQDHRLSSLSGGQKQKVYLACSMINDPKVIFLDEPTTGLDPSARRELWSYCLELKKQGKAILLTTHYMEEAVALADKVAIMDRGEIIAEGGIEDIIKSHCSHDILDFSFAGHPQNSETTYKNIIGKTRWLQGATCKDGVVSVPTSTVTETIKKLILESEENNIHINQLNIRPSTLEDVFVKLTGRGFDDSNQP